MSDHTFMVIWFIKKCSVEFCVFLPTLLNLMLLLVPHICLLLCPSLREIFPWLSLLFLMKSLVFPILLFSSISLHCSLKKTFLSLLAILRNFAFSWVYHFSPLPSASLLSLAICKVSSDNHFATLHFYFFGMTLIIGSYTVLWNSVPHSLGTLVTTSNPLNLYVTSTL